MRIEALLLSLVLLGFLAVPAVSPATQPIGSTPGQGNLLMTKLSTNAVKVGNCFQGTVSMNLTWTQSNQTYTIGVQSFSVVIIVPNQAIGNSTSTSYIQSSNTLQQFNLFPDNPVTLVLSFRNVCTTSANNLRLFYIDPQFQFRFNLP